MRFLFLLLFTISIFRVNAQIVKNEQKIGWKGDTDDVRLNSFPNKDRSLNCVFLSTSEYLKGFVYNSKIQIKHRFNTFNLIDQNVIGGFFGDTTLTVVLENNKIGEFRSLIFNLKNDSLISNRISSINIDDKKQVGVINAGDNFYCILASKTLPYLSISNFKNKGRVTENIYELNKDLNTNLTDKEMFKALTASDGINRPFRLAVIDEKLKTSADKAISKVKVYLKDNNLILTVDDKIDETKFFTLNLDNNKSTYRNIKFYPFQSTKNPPVSKSNSFLIENSLYHFSVNNDNLKLTALNLNTSDTLKNYIVNKEQEIDFKNTNILQEGPSISRREIKIPTNHFLRKTSNGNAFISGFKNQKGQYEFTIGAYTFNAHQEKANSQIVIGGLVGGMIGGAIAGALTSHPNPKNGWSVVTRFKSLFDSNTGQHLQGEIIKSGSDLIDEYVREANMPVQGSDTFYSDGNTYYTYYDNDLKSLITIQLK